MNNAGTVLLTIADMSVIEAEIEVDETDIPFVTLGQPAKVTIDAIPDQTFNGQSHGSRQQPDPGRRTAATGRAATNFKVVVTHRRSSARRASGIHLHRGNHHGDGRRACRRCRFRR